MQTHRVNRRNRRLTITKAEAPGTVVTFILRVGVGAVSAFLLAPKAGEELRADIAQGIREGANHVRSSGKDIKQRTQKLVDLAGDDIQVAIDAGEKEYTQAKKA